MCGIHDAKTPPPADSNIALSCTCMFSEHLIDPDSVAQAYLKSPFVVNSISDLDPPSPKARLAKFVQYQVDAFNRVKDVVLATSNGEKSPCDFIEAYNEVKSQVLINAFNKNDKSSKNILQLLKL